MDTTDIGRDARHGETLHAATFIPSGERSHPPVTMPAAPRGSRKITTRSRFSARGYVVAHLPAHPDRQQRVGYESNLERSFVLLTLSQPDVADLVEQPFTVIYTDGFGRPRRYTFDYLVVRANGRRTAVEVKTAERANTARVRDKLSAVAAQLPPKLADEFRLFTNADFEPWMTVNAAQLLHCRRKPDHAADEALASTISGLNGQITIAELVDLTGIGARGFRAIIRAIYANRLRPITPGIHGPKTLVTPEVLS
jgi:hypothetical protein